MVQIETHGYIGGWLRQSWLSGMAEVLEAGWQMVEELVYRNGLVTLEEERGCFKALASGHMESF